MRRRSLDVDLEGLAPATVDHMTSPAPGAAARDALLIVERRSDILAIFVLLGLTGLVAWQRLRLENGLAYLDIATFYLPWYAHLGEALRAFDIPGWNPYQLSGTPFASDPQSGWMYLPAMIFFTLLGPIAAYEWFLVFHVALAGVSAYALGRALGLRPLSGLVAGSAYAFGPLVNHISCCLIHVQLATWIPSALLGVELAARAQRWPGRFVGWALAGFAVSQILAGWVGQGAYNGLLVVGAYILYRTVVVPPRPVPWRERLRRLVVNGAMTLLLGFGLAAGGLLPRLDIIRDTNVAGGEYTGVGSQNYSLGWTATQLLDRLMSDGHTYFTYLYYLGGPALTLTFAACVLARRRFAAPFFLVLTAVTAVLTLEWITPLHRLFYLCRASSPSTSTSRPGSSRCNGSGRPCSPGPSPRPSSAVTRNAVSATPRRSRSGSGRRSCSSSRRRAGRSAWRPWQPCWVSASASLS